jgi:L-ascorbate metabolism protein UlaG (beta-lactamase superfamily)
MEITWFGASCVRLKGREGVVAADPFRSVVGPTGRGITADIVSFGYPDETEPVGRGARAKAGVVSRHLGVPLPTSLESAYVLDSPGEFEIHDVMVTGVRTFRDAERGEKRGASTAFVYELDGILTAHLGNIGHVLDADTIREMGHVDVICLGIGPQMSAAQAAEVIAQLDAAMVVPMPLTDAAAAAAGDLARFLKEMSADHPQPVPRLNVTISSLPAETTVVLLEQRGKS